MALVMALVTKRRPGAWLSRKTHLVISGDLFLSLLCHHRPDDTHVKRSYGSMLRGCMCVRPGVFSCVSAGG